jgi:SAM-dependent methyltransferase
MIENKQCLACGSDELITSLDLGMQPLANNLTHIPNDQDRYPLAVNLCKSCYHLQLTHTVDPTIIYSNYLYVSGTSQTLKDYSEWFAGYVNETCNKVTNNVLDIGCNDGTQLNYFKKLEYNTFGIDPAKNIYPISSRNHSIVCDYFGPHIVYGFDASLDAITAQNVFAHNPNPIEFLQTCKKLMSSHTKLYIQTSQADMVLNNEFDTIYHEHVNFFNINSMNELAKRAGINLIDVVKTPIHGNSYVFVLSLTESRPYHIQNLIDMEHKLTKLDTYVNWEENVKSNMSLLKSTIEQYRNDGFKIIGYGAAAKGNTLLNYIDTPLDLIIDDSPLKQNLYAPGTCSPIKSIDSLNNYSETDRILFIPLAWNFFTEISQRIKSVRNEPTDLFLKYFPKVNIVRGDNV